MSARRRSSVALSGLTPLVDLLFILLFSLLALGETRRVEQEELVAIELPSVESSADSRAPAAALTLAIDSESRVVLPSSGRVILTRRELDAELASALGDGVPEEVTVAIHADRAARHGAAVELLQHMRLRGFVHVQLLATGQDDGDGFLEGGR